MYVVFILGVNTKSHKVRTFFYFIWAHKCMVGKELINDGALLLLSLPGQSRAFVLPGKSLKWTSYVPWATSCLIFHSVAQLTVLLIPPMAGHQSRNGDNGFDHLHLEPSVWMSA